VRIADRSHQLRLADNQLAQAETCANIAKTVEDSTLKSIYLRMSELHRDLHLEMKRLADWKNDG
jgi:hypothetical protein